MTENNARKCNIYTPHGVNQKNAIKIKFHETRLFGPSDRIQDTKLETAAISKNINREFYKCNMTDRYVESNDKIPLLYTNVSWGIKVKSSLIYTIITYFTITTKTKYKEDLFNKELYGHFTVELQMDGETIELDKFNFYPGEKGLIKMLTEITETEEMKEVHEEHRAQQNKRIIEEYGNTLNRFSTIPKATIKRRRSNDK